MPILNGMLFCVRIHNYPTYNHNQHACKNNETGKEKVFEIGNVGIPTPRTKRLENINEQQGKSSCKQYQSNDIVFLVQIGGNLCIHGYVLSKKHSQRYSILIKETTSTHPTLSLFHPIISISIPQNKALSQSEIKLPTKLETDYISYYFAFKLVNDMEYTQRYLELNSQFQLGVDTHLDESNIDILFCSFHSSPQLVTEERLLATPSDSKIDENFSFVYPIFMPSGIKKAEKAILLLHGLNERNWCKYLTWAEYLCEETGKAVILFPIAFHVNRSPLSWTNPRDLKYLLDFRRHKNGEDRSLSFANATFSERISEEPSRFYFSGRQSINDLSYLFGDIKNGSHPLFIENTQVDIFSYSIGSFLAEITMMTNPKNLFTDSKLFMLCGGGIFSSMHGESRFIMDKKAYESLFQYYLKKFSTDMKLSTLRDKVFESFNSMISVERNQKERVSFFEQLGNRLKGISLAKDKVMPYFGVAEALGNHCASNRISQMDFPFDYSHENPFPVGKLINRKEVDASFTNIFSQAVEFLA